MHTENDMHSENIPTTNARGCVILIGLSKIDFTFRNLESLIHYSKSQSAQRFETQNLGLIIRRKIHRSNFPAPKFGLTEVSELRNIKSVRSSTFSLNAMTSILIRFINQGLS